MQSSNRILLGGFLALAVVMGIARFAYTPILPLMMDAGLFTEKGAGYLASSNYIGYFVGALFATYTGRWWSRKSWVGIGLAASVLTTGFMSVGDSFSLWIVIRFISGVASGIVFVCASSIVIDELTRVGRSKAAGLLYGGVGTGILLASLAVPMLIQWGDWRVAWLGMALISLGLSGVIGYAFKDASETRASSNTSSKDISGNHNSHAHIIHPQQRMHPLIPWLITVYGLEGLGYIVSATFLVAQVESMNGGSEVAPYVWAIVGIGAIPSGWIWARMGERYGTTQPYVAALLLQAVGMIIPVWFDTVAGAIVGSLLFGATFMGIVTLAMSQVKQLLPERSQQMIGLLTTVYGLGQIIGPAIAGGVIARSGTYIEASIGSAAVVLLAALILVIGSRIHRYS